MVSSYPNGSGSSSRGGVVSELQVGVPVELTLDEMRVVASCLWSTLPGGAVVWLAGDLGAGKTTFVQQLMVAADADVARSPTYSLVHEYDGPNGVIFHVDCYRLRAPEEAVDLDFPGLLRAGSLVLIEWPEKGGSFVPDPSVSLSFSHCADPALRQVERLL